MDKGTEAVAFVLIRVFVEAHLSTISARKGQEFLRQTGRLLAQEASLSEITKIGPLRDVGADGDTLRRALVWYTEKLPTFTARL